MYFLLWLITWNARFDDDMLNSEMKAVIQELKRDRDNYTRELVQQMIATTLPDHPYHYPIIGYKQDLWSVSGDDLCAFYQKHYIPNNATLVVVGDVHHEEVFALAKKHFESIAPNSEYKKRTFVTHPDIVSKSVSLYRDVQQPKLFFAFIAPGSGQKADIALEALSWVLAKKRNSRLYKKLIDETKLATSVGASYWDLFDYSLFMITVLPKRVEDAGAIEDIIKNELLDVAANGFSDEEFDRAIKNAQMDLYGIMEDIEAQAYSLGQSYLATGDEGYIFNSLQHEQEIRVSAQDMVIQYFRPAIMHKGFLLPIAQEEKKHWVALQKESDMQDKAILSNRIRSTDIEPAVYAHTISAVDPEPFYYPKPEICVLSNGIKVLYYADSNMKKATIELNLKAKSFYDPIDKQGLYNFVTDMIFEGTKKYTNHALAQVIESKGMTVSVYPGGATISLLSDDVPFGLEILHELLVNATFPEDHIEKVRAQLLSQIKRFWDEPSYFADQLVRQTMYKGHPYEKNSLGTVDSINSITREDLVSFYEKYFSADGASISIVGDVASLHLPQLLEKTIGSVPAGVVEDAEFPILQGVQPEVITHQINRDQIVLALMTRSIDRSSPDFEKLLIFDQIFGGGQLGSMASRLFALREATGLFYSIGGSLVSGSDEQKGLFKIKTIVSVDRLDEAIDAIKKTIDTTLDTITDEELSDAKRAIVNGQIEFYSTSAHMADVLLYLNRFDLPFDFFDTRMQRLNAISKEDIQKAVRPFLQSDKMTLLKIGRVEN